jgi:phospholipid/cholesterol/gamma-HCH transport system substrate-binding protein
VTDEARERRAILADAQKAIQDVDKTAQSITELSQSTNRLVNGDAKRSLANVAEAADELKKASRDARDMIGKLQGPTTDFATNGLPQLTSTISSLQETAQSLNGLIGDVRKSPSSLLSKPPAKEVKVKP